MPDLMHPQDLQKLFVQMKDLQASGRQGGGFSARIRTATDRWLWMSGVGRVLTDDDGAIIGGIDALRDIQAEHNMSVALRESEAHFRLLALHSADVVAQLTADGRFAWVSPSAEEMLHVPARSLLGRAVTEIVHPGDRAQLSAQLQATLDDSVSAPSTVRVETAGGDYRWVEASLHRIAPETPSSAAVVIRLRDVDEAVRAYRDLSRSERRFRTAMQSAPIAMAVSDLDDRITEANPALGLMLGHERSWLQHQRLTDIVDKRDVDTVVDMHDELFSGRIDAIRREVRLRRADDTPVWVDLALAIVRDDDWEPLSFVAQALDITASREARASLEYLADHDPLTGAKNRRSFIGQLASALDTRADVSGGLCVLYADLDGLKTINDELGHAAGDDLIRTVARRFDRALRTTDVFGRIGGDEFAALLRPVADADEAAELATGILASVAEPIDIEDRTLVPSLSIGLACAEPADDPETLLRRADVALYRAKHAGGHRLSH